MKRLFASDFDGTIHFWDTDDQYLVSPTDTDAIRAFQQEGGLFGVCTGRPLRGLTRQTDGKLGFSFDFYIAMSGAVVFDAQMRPIFSRSIPRAAIEELYERFATHHKGGYYALFGAADDYWTIQADRAGELLAAAPSLAEVPEPFCGLAMMLDTEDDAARVAAEICAAYGDVVTAFQNQQSVDVVPAGCSKGTGLRLVAEHFGADVTAGIGDSFNDVPLLDAADVAYTFESSPADVRAHADVLVSSAAEALRDFAERHVIGPNGGEL